MCLAFVLERYQSFLFLIFGDENEKFVTCGEQIGLFGR